MGNIHKREFQVGDTVRDATDGMTTVITRINGQSVYGYWVEKNGTKRDQEQSASVGNLELIRAVGKRGRVKKEKPEAPFRFLLQYELESDPLELFKTMAEVKARVANLVETERYVKKDSFKVYELKGLPKVIKVSTAVRVGR